MRMDPSVFAATPEGVERVTSFLRTVYGWMCIGLLVTAAVAFAVVSSPALIQALVGNRLIFWILLFADLGLVVYLSARINALAPGTAAGLFLLYSALNGVTFSVVLLRYTGGSVASA